MKVTQPSRYLICAVATKGRVAIRHPDLGEKLKCAAPLTYLDVSYLWVLYLIDIYFKVTDAAMSCSREAANTAIMGIFIKIDVFFTL